MLQLSLDQCQLLLLLFIKGEGTGLFGREWLNNIKLK